jgi:predicted nucleic acid-binding protein
MSRVCMLDTNICSFIMRERPAPVLDRLQATAAAGVLEHRSPDP